MIVDAPKFNGDVHEFLTLEKLSGMVIICTLSRYPLRCILVALILMLGSRKGQEEGEGPDKRRCSKTLQGS